MTQVELLLLLLQELSVFTVAKLPNCLWSCRWFFAMDDRVVGTLITVIVSSQTYQSRKELSMLYVKLQA